MNVGKENSIFTGLRAAGSKHKGVTYGGVYYPAHMKNGVQVNARFEAVMFLNRRGYKDANNVQHEGRSETIRIVAWNSNNSKPGKGMADIFAKCISVGKELHCDAQINSFDKRLFINGQPIGDAQGNQITYPAINFRITEFLFGDDSEATVTAEIAAYNSQINFCSRPQFWNVQGHADNATWKNIIGTRMAAVCNPQAGNYGYARIVIPEGAQLIDPAATGTVAAEPTKAAAQVLNAATTVEPTPAAEGGAVNSFAI